MKIFLYYPLKRGGFKPQFFGKNQLSYGDSDCSLKDIYSKRLTIFGDV